MQGSCSRMYLLIERYEKGSSRGLELEDGLE